MIPASAVCTCGHTADEHPALEACEGNVQRGETHIGRGGQPSAMWRPCHCAEFDWDGIEPT